LLRLRDRADTEAWREFVALYGPLIYQFARGRGLQDADADDLTQIVLGEVSGSVARLDYDPSRGSFRGWLFTVVRHQLSKFRTRQGVLPRGSGDTGLCELLEQQPGPEESEEVLWDGEYRRQLFLRAAEKVQGSFEESSWRAFWRTAVEGEDAPEVARMLGISVGAVYTAKSRILNRIKQEIQRLGGDDPD